MAVLHSRTTASGNRGSEARTARCWPAPPAPSQTTKACRCRCRFRKLQGLYSPRRIAPPWPPIPLPVLWPRHCHCGTPQHQVEHNRPRPSRHARILAWPRNQHGHHYRESYCCPAWRLHFQCAMKNTAPSGSPKSSNINDAPWRRGPPSTPQPSISKPLASIPIFQQLPQVGSFPQPKATHPPANPARRHTTPTKETDTRLHP